MSRGANITAKRKKVISKEEITNEGILELIEILDEADVPTDNRLLWFDGDWYGN